MMLSLLILYDVSKPVWLCSRDSTIRTVPVMKHNRYNGGSQFNRVAYANMAVLLVST